MSRQNSIQLQMVDVVGQYRKIKAEIDAGIQAVLEAGNYILGRQVGEFECQVAGFLDVKYAVGCASGTDALQVAMMAEGIGSGDEVITTPFSFVATTETIALLGARPVYVDIDPDTFNIDPGLIERAITKNTKAIIPVHLYGQMAEMDLIMDVARKHGLKVIEDGAQAIGATYRGKHACTVGKSGCISFYPSKNLGAFGDAGMVVTNDQAVWERLRMIIVHGSRTRYEHEILGVNSRLDTIQAVILSVKLKHLEEWNALRRQWAARYDALLRGTPVTLPHVAPERTHTFHQYTIRAPRRDGLAAHLKSRGVPHAIYYPIPLHLQKAFGAYGYRSGDFPVAERMAEEVLSLPMHSELTEEQVAFITEAVKSFYGSH